MSVREEYGDLGKKREVNFKKIKRTVHTNDKECLNSHRERLLKPGEQDHLKKK